nr:MAG TPA: hypothetical protein [Caudoviricetes sp.]
MSRSDKGVHPEVFPCRIPIEDYIFYHHLK